MSTKTFIRWTELDRTMLPEFLERIARADAEGTPTQPRRYPGYRRWPLQRLSARRGKGLDRVLGARRSRRLKPGIPSRRALSRLLQFAHGITADQHRGPTPTAGGLQALELYCVHTGSGWLPPGMYHYDREGHYLSQIADGTDRAEWEERVPSLRHIQDGALLWVLVGDGDRVAAKYGERGYRFLLLEAGHLMQNLSLLSESLGLSTVALGGFLEREIAAAFTLPASDLVLYVGVCGEART